MKGTISSCFAIACATALASGVGASEVGVTLDLEFNTPGDTNSGGIWTAVAKADERGLAGIRMTIADISFDEGTGFLAPGSFEVQVAADNVFFFEIVAADDLNDPVLDVGVIGSWTTNYPNDDGFEPLIGEPDLGAFAGGVALATGTFDPGDIPSWFDNRDDEPPGNDFTDANLFVDASATRAQADSVLLTVRAVPEPAALGLWGFGLSLIVWRRWSV